LHDWCAVPIAKSRCDLLDSLLHAKRCAMLKVKVTTNVDEVVDSVGEKIRSAQSRAVPRALRVLGERERRIAVRGIARVYGLTQAKIDEYITSSLDQSHLEYIIRARGKGLPLMLFNPRQTKQGVRVRIKGRSITIPHAFIGTMRSGHIGVFARGAYGGKSSGSRPLRRRGDVFGRFVFGLGRLPINELFTTGVPVMMRNEDIQSVVISDLEQRAAQEFARQYRDALRGY
jgi:hypothetical protein